MIAAAAPGSVGAAQGKQGTIVDLDPIDALGWIDLDEGGHVRFGGSALKGFEVHPVVGSRVVVGDAGGGGERALRRW